MLKWGHAEFDSRRDVISLASNRAPRWRPTEKIGRYLTLEGHRHHDISSAIEQNSLLRMLVAADTIKRFLFWTRKKRHQKNSNIKEKKSVCGAGAAISLFPTWFKLLCCGDLCPTCTHPLRFQFRAVSPPLISVLCSPKEVAKQPQQPVSSCLGVPRRAWRSRRRRENIVKILLLLREREWENTYRIFL